jgi:hypothetical protein
MAVRKRLRGSARTASRFSTLNQQPAGHSMLGLYSNV